jgi:hypothetical protein
MLTATTTVTGSNNGTGPSTFAVVLDGTSYNATIASDSAITALTGAATFPAGISVAEAGGIATFTAYGKHTISVAGGTSAGVTLGAISSMTFGYYYTYTFSSFNSTLQVPQNGTLPLTLKGDLAPWTSGSASDNSTSTFSIATSSDVTALGASSSKAPTVTLTSANGNPMTVLRTTLTPALAAVGSQRAARSTQDEVATITVTANSAGPATLNTLQLTLTGSLVSSTVSSTFFNNVSLWLNGTQLTSAQATDTYNTASGTIIWSFKTGTTLGTQISAGASDVFQLVINDNQGTSLGSNGTSLGLNIAIQNTGDVNYTDSSLGAGGTTVSLPANIVPMSTQVSFGQGV